MSVKTLYLVGYNVACAVGWAYVLYLTLVKLQTHGSNKKEALWASIGEPLTIVQSAAFLEVVHALIGLVSSPVLTVAMQVSSRLLLVWCYSRVYVSSQHDWSMYLMVISWSLVEVPRYLFYVFAQFKSVEMPYGLFWLRYSLFMILYPTGISGEVLQMYAGISSKACPEIWIRLTYLVYAIYFAGSPYMILNMWGNRVRSFKKRIADANPPPPPSGLVWPVTKEATQERESTPTNKHIWSASVGAVDAAAQAKLDKEKNWRFGYARHAEKSVQIALASEANALAMAKAGLAAAHKSFRFRRGGEPEISLGEAMLKYTGSFETVEIEGKDFAQGKAQDLQVPYGGRDPRRPYFQFRQNLEGQLKGRAPPLSGEALLAQLTKWQEWGTIEASAAESIRKVVENKWMDLSGMYFVLLGATSAMGPLDLLLQYGANVIAVDIDRPNVWAKIIEKARNSRGKVFLPVARDKMPAGGKFANDTALAAVAGANLLDKTPEICNWLKTVCPGKDLIIGNYTYLDGALHVQLSVGCDAIMQGVCAVRKSTSIAFLCTPTDLHVIPRAAHEAAAHNFKTYPWWLRLVASLGTSMLRRNALAPVGDIYYVDGLSIAQGPNYGLAKRLQHWRAIVARSEGHKVSSNVAPSTATLSVTSNAMFQAAYGGFHVFRPLEVMYQETSNAVMTALLVADLRDPASYANPKVTLKNPYQLFEHNSFHGGVWRCGYKLDTIGEVSVVYFLLANYSLPISAGLAALGSVAFWVMTGKIGPF